MKYILLYFFSITFFSYSSASQIENLPELITFTIFQKLSPEDRLVAGQCCQSWNKMSNQPLLWKERIESEDIPVPEKYQAKQAYLYLKLYKFIKKVYDKADIASQATYYETICNQEYQEDFLFDLSCKEFIYNFEFITDILNQFCIQKNSINLILTFNKLQNIKDFDLRTVVKLDLSNNLIKEWPLFLKDLVNLKILYFNNNKLEEIPDCIESLTNLQKIYLANNNLKKISNALQNLTQLEDINVENNVDLVNLPLNFQSQFYLRILGVRGTNIQLRNIPSKIHIRGH